MTDTLHVSPVGDLVPHDTTTDQPDCICGPRVERVDTDSGDGYVIIHAALDWREAGDQGVSGG